MRLGAIRYLVLLILLVAAGGCQRGAVRDNFGDQEGDFDEQSEQGRSGIYVKLAVAYMQEGQLGMALKKIKRGIEIEPDNGEAHNVLAILYQRLGENDLAERHFKRATGLQPRNPYIRNAYGSFLCQEQRYGDADQQFQTALENPLYKTPEVALTNAGICARKDGDQAKAESYFRKALKYRNNYPPVLIQMAQLSYDVGDALSARGYMQRYQAVAKHTAASLWSAIQIERALGDRDAVASYEMQLRGNFPDSKEYQLMRESRR